MVTYLILNVLKCGWSLSERFLTSGHFKQHNEYSMQTSHSMWRITCPFHYIMRDKGLQSDTTIFAALEDPSYNEIYSFKSIGGYRRYILQYWVSSRCPGQHTQLTLKGFWKKCWPREYKAHYFIYCTMLKVTWFIPTKSKVSLLAVDEMHMNLPRMEKDIYWNDSSARPPYTKAAADYCIPSFLGSTIEMGWVALRVLNAIRKITTPTAHTEWRTVSTRLQAVTILWAGKVEMGNGVRRERTEWCWWDNVSRSPYAHTNCRPVAWSI